MAGDLIFVSSGQNDLALIPLTAFTAEMHPLFGD